jgi:hypothetical protein
VASFAALRSANCLRYSQPVEFRIRIPEIIGAARPSVKPAAALT